MSSRITRRLSAHYSWKSTTLWVYLQFRNCKTLSKLRGYNIHNGKKPKGINTQMDHLNLSTGKEPLRRVSLQ